MPQKSKNQSKDEQLKTIEQLISSSKNIGILKKKLKLLKSLGLISQELFSSISHYLATKSYKKRWEKIFKQQIAEEEAVDKARLKQLWQVHIEQMAKKEDKEVLPPIINQIDTIIAEYVTIRANYASASVSALAQAGLISQAHAQTMHNHIANYRANPSPTTLAQLPAGTQFMLGAQQVTLPSAVTGGAGATNYTAREYIETHYKEHIDAIDDFTRALQGRFDSSSHEQYKHCEEYAASHVAALVIMCHEDPAPTAKFNQQRLIELIFSNEAVSNVHTCMLESHRVAQRLPDMQQRPPLNMGDYPLYDSHRSGAVNTNAAPRPSLAPTGGRREDLEDGEFNPRYK